MYGRILYYRIGLNTSHRGTNGRESKSGGNGLREEMLLKKNKRQKKRGFGPGPSPSTLLLSLAAEESNGTFGRWRSMSKI